MVVGFVLLTSTIFVALVGLPILWWPRGRGIAQVDFTGPQGRATARWRAAQTISAVHGQRAYA